MVKMLFQALRIYITKNYTHKYCKNTCWYRIIFLLLVLGQFLLFGFSMAFWSL